MNIFLFEIDYFFIYRWQDILNIISFKILNNVIFFWTLLDFIYKMNSSYFKWNKEGNVMSWVQQHGIG